MKPGGPVEDLLGFLHNGVHEAWLRFGKHLGVRLCLYFDLCVDLVLILCPFGSIRELLDL